jgi:yopX protein|uniref:YopX protein n=1 Tax=Siphoviridae sp. ctg2r17 TaxID=2825601 RepID=A0A8S5P1Y4_9CAUD|nr:MAG TPA: YopX protein [Siphoviridae sp. ctg2r17]
MREIKFRVWDKQCHLYLTLAGADWGSIKDRGTFCNFKYIHLFPPEDVPMRNPSPHYGGCVSFKLTDSVDNDRLVFEQFTGLKDKNGTEICEGDVLIDDTGEPIEYWVVKFADGGFVGECAGVTESLFELTQLEVAGNIHENSELVEEK